MALAAVCLAIFASCMAGGAALGNPLAGFLLSVFLMAGILIFLGDDS
jgi:hypothetical protein